RVKRKVIEHIYLNLHEDEIEFSNAQFRVAYLDIISFYQKHNYWSLESYLSTLSPEMSAIITSIVMDDEKYKLDNWEAKNIFVKAKTDTLSQLVTENIDTLRLRLIHDDINQQKNDLIQKNPEDSNEILSEIIDYTKLIKAISNKLGRVLSRF